MDVLKRLLLPRQFTNYYLPALVKTVLLSYFAILGHSVYRLFDKKPLNP
jgi:hypothetical protein